MGPDLEVRTAFDGDVATITITGEIDLASSTQLNRELDAALDRRPSHVRLDLDGVDFMDTTGVAALLKARRRALEQHSRFTVLSSSAVITRLLEITGLTALLRE